MKKRLMALCLISQMSTAADLTAGRGVEFLALNGQAVSHYGDDADKVITLNEGRYQLVVRYEHDVKRGSKTTLFTSKPYVVEVDMGADSASLTIPRMRFESQAQSYFRDPKWIFTSESNGEELKLNSTMLEGVSFGASNIETVLAAYNTRLSGQFVTAKPISETETLGQLKLLYSQANLAEQQAFKSWLASK